MVSKRSAGLAIYAIALIVAGVYGYVAMTSAQTIDYSSSLCSAPRGGTTLPPCVPSETISETGSALMFPMFELWAKNFSQLYPNFQINTANTGSGTGQSFVEKGLVQIGASGAYLSDYTQHVKFPNILDIPLAVTADIIDYNIPELNAQNVRLNFTAPLLAEIYNTTIQYWDDHRILSINPGAVRFLQGCGSRAQNPCVIWPTYRSDAEDDTLYFTQYLSYGDAWWNSTVGSGLQVPWPACTPPPSGVPCPSTPQSSLGNPGIVIATAARAYAMSYVSVEALDQWVLCKPHRTECNWQLGYGLLRNNSGAFVDATLQNINATLTELASKTPSDERFSLVNANGTSAYPIVGYAYALVNQVQVSPQFALVLRTFLTFCMLPDYGNSLKSLSVYHFAPLPAGVLKLSLNQTSVIGP